MRVFATILIAALVGSVMADIEMAVIPPASKIKPGFKAYSREGKCKQVDAGVKQSHIDSVNKKIEAAAQEPSQEAQPRQEQVQPGKKFGTLHVPEMSDRKWGKTQAAARSSHQKRAPGGPGPAAADGGQWICTIGFGEGIIGVGDDEFDDYWSFDCPSACVIEGQRCQTEFTGPEREFTPSPSSRKHWSRQDLKETKVDCSAPKPSKEKSKPGLGQKVAGWFGRSKKTQEVR